MPEPCRRQPSDANLREEKNGEEGDFSDTDSWLDDDLAGTVTCTFSYLCKSCSQDHLQYGLGHVLSMPLSTSLLSKTIDQALYKIKYTS